MSGPYTFQFRVSNPLAGTQTGQYLATCGSNTSQVTCTTNPSTFSLASLATRTVTATYYVKGMGHFRMTAHAEETAHDPTVSQTIDVGFLDVTGAPMVAYVTPDPAAILTPQDTMFAKLTDSSGIIKASVRTFLDGKDSTSAWTITDSTIRSHSPEILSVGGHLWTTYACANNGRCDSVSLAFGSSAASTHFALDDSLPPLPFPSSQLGPLTAPPDSLKGCPLAPDYPEIFLYVGGASVGSQIQSTDSLKRGMIFFAGKSQGLATLVISTATHDYTLADNHTCAQYHYAAKYNPAEWSGIDLGDSLWNRYPYGDVHPMISLLPRGPFPVGFGEYDFDVLGSETADGRPDNPALVGLASLWAGIRTDQRRQEAASERFLRRDVAAATTGAWRPDPGDINPASLNVSINGTPIVTNGVGLLGATIDTSKSNKRLGQTVYFPLSSSRVHKYNPVSPNNPADSGGWNEVQASIADGSGHRTVVRARFVQFLPDSGVPGGTIAALSLTPLRNFRHHSEGDCAAFGAFQCDGLVTTATIAGFVSRDKPRDLHLIYRSASQRMATQIPLQVFVNVGQKAPTVLNVITRESGVSIGDTMRYAGTDSVPASAGIAALSDNKNETRVMAAEINPAASQAAIRHVTMSVTQVFKGPPVTTWTDSLKQDVVQLYLTDTTSTRFGAGWQLAELSRLVLGQTWQSTTAAILVNGDGSYEIFTKPASLWVAPPAVNDSLGELTGSIPTDSAKYILYLDSGARVGYRADGWQAWTSDVMGNRTSYIYSGARLSQIIDPNGSKFIFGYVAADSGLVGTIQVQPKGSATSRTVATLTYNSGKTRLTAFGVAGAGTARDTTRFGYEMGSNFLARGAFLDSIIDPRDTPSNRIITTVSYETGLYAPLGLARPKDRLGILTAYFRAGMRRASPRATYGRGASQPWDRMVDYRQLRGTEFDFTGAPTDFTVDPFGGPTWVDRLGGGTAEVWESPLDDVRRIQRDTLGRVLTIKHGVDSLDVVSDSVTFHYASNNHIDEIWRTTLAYPDTGKADSLLFSYSWATVSGTGARCLRLSSATDPMGGVTSVAYGFATGGLVCLPSSVTSFSDGLTQFTYNSSGPSATRPVSITPATGVTITSTFDTTTWNTATAKRASDPVSSYQYDSFGRLTQSTDPAGVITRMIRDSAGRVTHMKTGTGPLVPTVKHWYGKDGLDTLTQVYATTNDLQLDTPASGIQVQGTHTYYSTTGMVDSTVGSGGRRQSWRYDATGHRLRSTAGNGSSVGYAYDWRGGLIQTALSPVRPTLSMDGQPFADAATMSYIANTSQYSSVADKKTRSEGGQYYYGYDNKGRNNWITGIDNYLGHISDQEFTLSRGNAVVQERSSYDEKEANNSFTMTRNFTYNRRGQRLTARDSLAFAASGPTMDEKVSWTNYTYDNATGRLTSLAAYVDSSGTQCNFANVTWVYDAAGRDTTRTVTARSCDGHATTYVLSTQFDSLGRVLARAGKNNGTSVYSFGLPAYQNAGVDNLSSFLSRIPSDSFARGTQYLYDSIGTRRLISSTSRTGFVQGYRFDTFGNRTWQQQTGPGTLCTTNDTITYTVDNRISGRTNNPCSRNSLFYTDNAGSLLSEYATGLQFRPSRMSYTALGQLYYSYAWSGAHQPASYNLNWNWYDGTGKRVMAEARVDSVSNGSTAPGIGPRTFYLYDGSDVAMEVVYNQYNGAWAVRQRYVVGGLDAPIAVRSRQGITGTAQSFALVADHQGSIIAALRAKDGQWDPNVGYYETEPFGGLSNRDMDALDGQVNPEVGYTGAQTPTVASGFVYMRNRWYDPQTGRFLTQDPIGLAGGSNLYAYAGNNPVSFGDPFGLRCSPQVAQRLKQRIRNGAKSLARHVKQWREFTFDKVNPETGERYLHPETIEAEQQSVQRNIDNYNDNCDDDDDSDFRNGLSAMKDILSYKPGPQLKLLEVNSRASAGWIRMDPHAAAAVGAVTGTALLWSWLIRAGAALAPAGM